MKKDVEKGQFKRPEEEFVIEVPQTMSAINVDFDLNVDTNERPSQYVNQTFKKEGEETSKDVDADADADKEKVDADADGDKQDDQDSSKQASVTAAAASIASM